MTARTSVQTQGSNSFQTTAEDLNAIATDFISDGIVGTLTNTAGVAPATGGLSANAQGSPDRTVAIGAGFAYVTATPSSQASQRLRVKIEAQNVTHATNTSGSTRFDWIYVKVDPTLAANPAVAGDTTGTMVISRSTSSSVDNGTPPTYGKNIAIVTLTNNYTTIVNGNIADTRALAGSGAIAKGALGRLAARQGGSATVWDTTGTTNFDLTSVPAVIQAGSAVTASGVVTITFPVAFAQTPIVIATTNSAVSNNCFARVDTKSATSCKVTLITDAGVVGAAETVNWIAIGV